MLVCARRILISELGDEFKAVLITVWHCEYLDAFLYLYHLNVTFFAVKIKEL